MKKYIPFIPAFLILLFVNTEKLVAQSLAPFDKIVLTGNVSALLIEGNEPYLEIKNDEEQLKFEVENQTLKIASKDLIKYNQTPTIKVIITYKYLRELRARAGASIYTKQTLETDAIDLKFSSGAVGEIAVETKSLSAGVSEGGSLELYGTTNFLDAKAATGGSLSAFELDCKNATVKANTGGNAKVMVTESIDAKAATGGNISYRGNPKKVKQKDGLSGTVKAY